MRDWGFRAWKEGELGEDELNPGRMKQLVRKREWFKYCGAPQNGCNQFNRSDRSSQADKQNFNFGDLSRGFETNSHD